MNANDSVRRAWALVISCPVPGVELGMDGSFRIGDRRFSANAGLSGYTVDGVCLDKEPGDDRPLVAESAHGRVFLLYRDGLWYQSKAGPATQPTLLKPTRPVASPAALAQELPLEFASKTNGARGAPAERVLDLPCVEPGKIAPEAAPRPPSRPARQPWALLGPVLLVLVTLAASGLFQVLAAADRPTADRLARWCSFDETAWLQAGAYHTLLTHAFLHTSGAELAYFAAGTLAFGWLVQRNVGLLRTVLLFGFCAVAGVGFWQGAKTELGQDLLLRVVGKFFRWLAEQHGIETAVTAWLAYGRAMEAMLALRGAVSGGAGAVAGLIAFAACRRRLDGSAGVRWLVVVLAAVYLGLGLGYVWPVLLARQVPYALFVGGALGGLFFVFPDRFLDHVGKAVKERLQEKSEGD